MNALVKAKLFIAALKGSDMIASRSPTIGVSQKHVILTLGRSGSNTLVDLLNQNPAIMNYGEVLGPWNTIRKVQKITGLWKDDDAAYLDALLSNISIHRLANLHRNTRRMLKGRYQDLKAVRKVQTMGFKEFSLNLSRLGLQEYLVKRSDIKVIGLIRQNSLARMISYQMLEKTGVILSRKGKGTDQKPAVYLDIETGLSSLQDVEQERQELIAMLDALPPERVFRLDYEDMFASSERATSLCLDVQRFLGVPIHKPTVRMKKILPQDPLAALVNGDDMRSAIASSDLAHLLT